MLQRAKGIETHTRLRTVMDSDGTETFSVGELADFSVMNTAPSKSLGKVPQAYTCGLVVTVRFLRCCCSGALRDTLGTVDQMDDKPPAPTAAIPWPRLRRSQPCNLPLLAADVAAPSQGLLETSSVPPACRV
ncbi:unnamed protein product [Pleuronectes platessa]|uniref:Uncharacterized protein n=1 Tax=Pleuronectes platessa TaxID=8262 RepID=A0A9N7TSV0_PLEPL|nr:unnamed protein product [Pleuronectes platessa]